MKRAEDTPEAGGPCYTLYLEHLGGLVPILKGRRISKLRPEFVIMDPKVDSKAGECDSISVITCNLDRSAKQSLYIRPALQNTTAFKVWTREEM